MRIAAEVFCDGSQDAADAIRSVLRGGSRPGTLVPGSRLSPNHRLGIAAIRLKRLSRSKSTSGCGVTLMIGLIWTPASTAAYNVVVKRRTAPTTPTNGASRAAAVSPLGRDLTKIAERIASSGMKPLNRKDVAREVSERRGGR